MSSVSRIGAAVVAALATMALAGCDLQPMNLAGGNSEPSIVEAENFAGQVFDDANAAREDNDLDALDWDACSADMALVRAMAVLVEGELEHAPLQPECGGFTMVGENLYFGNLGPDGAVEGWLESPSHRENMLHENHEVMGIGCLPTAEGDRTRLPAPGERAEAMVCAQIFHGDA